MTKRSIIVCLVVNVVAAALAWVTSFLFVRTNLLALLVGAAYGILAFYTWRRLR